MRHKYTLSSRNDTVKHSVFIYEDNLCQRCLGTLNDNFLLLELAITKTQKREDGRQSSGDFS